VAPPSRVISSSSATERHTKRLPGSGPVASGGSLPLNPSPVDTPQPAPSPPTPLLSHAEPTPQAARAVPERPCSGLRGGEETVRGGRGVPQAPTAVSHRILRHPPRAALASPQKPFSALLRRQYRATTRKDVSFTTSISALRYGFARLRERMCQIQLASGHRPSLPSSALARHADRCCPAAPQTRTAGMRHSWARRSR